MSEPQSQPQANGRIQLDMPDLETLLKNEDFRLWREKTLARIAELRNDKGESLRKMREEWERTVDPQEAKETLEYLLNALAEEGRLSDV